MTLPEGFEIGNMRPHEVQALDAWATAEGWNPGQGDLELGFRVDPQAFIALRRQNDLVGAGSIFRHNAATGFMGLFIIRPDLRGQGLGSVLWYWRRDRLLARLGANATIGMDGVLDMVPFYHKGGFRQSHLNVRFQGLATPAPPAGCIDLAAIDRAELRNLDRAAFGSDRCGFLTSWLDRQELVSLAVVEDGRLAGFGIARPCKTGYKIGPLYARTPHLADRLLSDICSRIAGNQVQIDAPDIVPDAARIFTARGWTPVFSCARLYLGVPPNADLSQTYGVASLEFG